MALQTSLSRSGKTARISKSLLLSGLALLGALPALSAQAGNPALFSPDWFAASAASRATASPNPAAASLSGMQAPTSSAVQQSIADFARAAQAIAQAQAAQSQAAAAAAAATIPDGLVPNGLQPDATATWSNAAQPAQTTSNGRTVVTVQQTAPQAILSWLSFNVGQHTTLDFDQSAGGASANTWVALNRVTDPNAAPSQILGSITAQGQVLVINRNGIIFGAGAQVNVGSLLASAADIPDAAFLSNGIDSSSGPNPSNPTQTIYRPSFTGASGNITVNSGASITTNAPAASGGRGGFAMLLGANVENDGAITTPNGQTVLAAGVNFILRQGYGTNSLLTSTTLGTEVAAAQSAQQMAQTSATTAPAQTPSTITVEVTGFGEATGCGGPGQPPCRTP